MSTHEFSRETIEALRRGQTPEGHAAIDQLNLMMNLLVESWDAMSATVKEHHLRLHNISPTLVNRIEAAIEPWNTGPREEKAPESRRSSETASFDADLGRYPLELSADEVLAEVASLREEPPEPDGECFRGGEAAGALAEEQARIQRELK